MILELKDVHSYYDKSHILNGVSLSVAEGTSVCLLGRNGVGKSDVYKRQARSNADPADPEQMKEGCERLQEAIDIGKEMGQYVIAMMVLVGNIEQATEMAKIVTGPKIFADVRAYKGEDGHYHPAVTMEELTPLGFKMCSSHYTMKAAMEGMLEHGLVNFKKQSVAYSLSLIHI